MWLGPKISVTIAVYGLFGERNVYYLVAISSVIQEYRLLKSQSVTWIFEDKETSFSLTFESNKRQFTSEMNSVYTIYLVFIIEKVNVPKCGVTVDTLKSYWRATRSTENAWQLCSSVAGAVGLFTQLVPVTKCVVGTDSGRVRWPS